MHTDIDLAQVVEAAGIELKRSGSRLMGLCPFHADTSPSLCVYPDGRWWCFSCSTGGDLFDFVMRFYGLTFPEALDFLGIKGEAVSPEKQETDGFDLGREIERAQEYLAGHMPEPEAPTLGIDDATILQVAFRLNDTINLNKQQEKIGERTGFNFLDSTIHGFLKTHLWILGGYTSHGKTALMVQLIVNALQHNPDIRIAIFSTEMSAEGILLRLMANRTGIPSLTIFRGKFSPDADEVIDGALNYFHDKRIWIYDDIYSFEGIRDRCRAIRTIFQLDLVFVDFIQNMEAEGSIYERMSLIPVHLQAMAKDLNTCVVAMSQVSNEAARSDSRVIGYKGAGEIAAACDLGLWLERDQQDVELLLCSIRKNRHGPTGKKRLRFTENFTRIVEE